MKKLAYYILAWAIIASYSTIARAADADPASDELNLESHFRISRITDSDSDTITRAADADPASDELNLESHFRISRITDSDSDKLSQKKSLRKPPALKITEEGEHEGVVYVKQSRLRKIIFSSPGEHEIKNHFDPMLNGYKYIELKNEEGKKVPFVFLSSFETKYKSRFPKDDKLIPCHMTALFPKASVWGVSVDMPSKKRSHRKHRSKRTTKAISKTKTE